MSKYHVMTACLLLALVGCSSSDWNSGEKVNLIDAETANGSFEDWSGAEVSKADEDWRKDAIRINQDARYESTSIPGWTLHADSKAGFEKWYPAPHKHAYAFGRLACHVVVVSEPKGKGRSFTEGTEIEIAYDVACHFPKGYLEKIKTYELSITDLLSTTASLIFDSESVTRDNYCGEENTGMRVCLGPLTPTDGYVASEVISVRFKHTLSDSEATFARKNGVRLAISAEGRNTHRNVIDNIKLVAKKP